MHLAVLSTSVNVRQIAREMLKTEGEAGYKPSHGLKMKFSMFECNELVENCFPLFGYAPIGKEPC